MPLHRVLLLTRLVNDLNIVKAIIKPTRICRTMPIISLTKGRESRPGAQKTKEPILKFTIAGIGPIGDTRLELFPRSGHVGARDLGLLLSRPLLLVDIELPGGEHPGGKHPGVLRLLLAVIDSFAQLSGHPEAAGLRVETRRLLGAKLGDALLAERRLRGQPGIRHRRQVRV
jgi:hypothetical protein